MARKTLIYTVDAENRDNGKTFFIKEMSATQAEKWAIRALLAIGKSGIDLPDGIEGAGFAAIAKAGIQAIMTLNFDDAEPLLDEIMSCVQIIPNPMNTDIKRTPIDDDFEEISTIVNLRKEVFKIHADFLTAVNK
jgi:hypothetical protein